HPRRGVGRGAVRGAVLEARGAGELSEPRRRHADPNARIQRLHRPHTLNDEVLVSYRRAIVRPAEEVVLDADRPPTVTQVVRDERHPLVEPPAVREGFVQTREARDRAALRREAGPGLARAPPLVRIHALRWA